MTSVIFRSAVSVRARLIIAALAVCSVALAGCQGGDATGSPENTATTTAAATSSATPTPTPTPSGVYKPADASGKAQNVPVPVKPPLADQNSKEGLEAFTKYWFELLSYGYETGDFSIWSAETQPDCSFCSSLKDGIVASHENGRWIVGGKISTPHTDSEWKDGASPQSVTVQVIQTQIDFYDPDGRVTVPATPESNTASVLFGKFADGNWLASDLGRLG